MSFDLDPEAAAVSRKELLERAAAKTGFWVSAMTRSIPSGGCGGTAAASRPFTKPGEI